MKSKPIFAIVTISILAVVLFSGINQASTLDPFVPGMNTGPYVDDVIYKIIQNDDQRILALQAGEIEFDTGFSDPVYLPTLAVDPDIDISSSLRNGYGHLTINCRDAPLNESILRRAFAYAFDKTAVTADIMDGFSQEHDSVVPYPNSWCVEDEFTYHYYTDQTAIGNALLDASGLFPIDGGSGNRTYKGAPFNITIEYAASSPTIAGGVAQIGVDALHRLDIDAYAQSTDFHDYISRLDAHGDYDMVFYALSYFDNDVDWLAYDYWSGYASTSYQNPCNFENATYDSWRDQLLYSTVYEDVFEAASEMQKILQYNVPRLVVYENTYIQGYRNDQFTGHVEDLARHIAGPWTMRKIHNIDDSPGGSVAVGLAEEPDSFNFFVSNSAYSTEIVQHLYSSLYKYGPDLNPVPDLVESMLIETHADNAAVPVGHTRYTLDIIQNASWTDGMPLTAEDVAFSYVYMLESGAFGNPAGIDLTDLVAAYAPTMYRVILEFSAESYWQFSNFAFDYIIPKHIFNDTGGIGYTGWNAWNPVFDPAEPHVTSGPFIFTDYVVGEFYEISANLDYYYAPEETTTTTTTSSTSTTTTPTTTEPISTTTVITSPPPVVISATGATYVVGTTGHTIQWNLYDDNPFMYVIYLDDVLNETGMWDGSDITKNVDGHLEGTYNYTLVVFDYSVNYAISTVFVNVVSATTNPTSDTTTDTVTTSTTSDTNTTGGFTLETLTLFISIGSLGIIIVVIIVIVKKK